MDPIDAGVDSATLLEAEIETLMMRLVETDPDAILRLEQLLYRVRIRRIVEKHFH